MFNYFPINSRTYKALTIPDMPPTLYSIMESIANFDEANPIKIKDLAVACREKVFNFFYPIGESMSKEYFEEMFLKHYMFRRINFDTFTSFRLHLEVKLNEIMPKYNKMLDGFYNMNFKGNVELHQRTQEDSKTSTTTGESSGTTSSSDTSTLDSRNSDTPQNELSDVRDGRYVSDYSYNTNTSSSSSSSSTESSSSSNDIGNLIENISISRGDSIEEYKKYMEIVDNVFSMIFRECDDLFYGII